MTTADVDIFGAERHEVVCRADRIGADVDTKGDDDQADGTEGGSGAATVRPGFHPQTDDFDGVPDDAAICRLRGCGGEDAEEAHNRCNGLVEGQCGNGGGFTEDEGDNNGLNVLCADFIGVAGEIGDVET